jgi:hypothetical protein
MLKMTDLMVKKAQGNYLQVELTFVNIKKHLLPNF